MVTFLDNRLVVYQGENVAEGESWTLKPENYKFVCSFYSDLCRIFKINAETRIFLGVRAQVDLRSTGRVALYSLAQRLESLPSVEPRHLRQVGR